jgi:lipopolysaccharide export LptBFGC system permease protein LptF
MAAFFWNWDVFFLVLLALLALSLIIFGVLTAYFGSNKSRIVGSVLLIVGLLLGIFVILGSSDVFKVSFVTGVLEPTVFYIIAAVIGVVIGLLIFLGAIMKT